jgi:hypothetical protein
MWTEIYHGILGRVKAWSVVTTASKRTKITIEANTVLTVRRLRSSRGWCQECAREVDLLNLDEASALAGMTHPAFRECVEIRKWHFSESSDGALLICLDSLTKSM